MSQDHRSAVNEIEILKFEDYEVRTVTIDGEPWWVLRDVCQVLGLSNASMVANRLNPRGVSQAYTPTAGGTQQVTVVSELALYELVLRSDKPRARAFSEWVTEKIKELRQTGVATVRPMSTIETLHIITRQMVEQERRLAAQEAKAAEQLALTQGQQARIEALEGNYGRYTALAYAKLNGLPDSMDYLNRLGRLAGQIARSEGVPAEKAHSTIFGTVNTWPVEIWDEALRVLPDESVIGGAS